MKLVSGYEDTYTQDKHARVELDALRRKEVQRRAAAASLARKYKLMNLTVQGTNTTQINETGSRQRTNSLTANTPLTTCCHMKNTFSLLQPTYGFFDGDHHRYRNKYVSWLQRCPLRRKTFCHVRQRTHRATHRVLRSIHKRARKVQALKVGKKFVMLQVRLSNKTHNTINHAAIETRGSIKWHSQST